VKSAPKLASRLCPLHIPLAPDEENGWKPYNIFSGSTTNLQSLTCHVSVLVKGHCPHPPHTHREEEILLLLTGEVDLIIAQERVSKDGRGKRLKPGQFVYYPAQFAHTLRTVSKEPANYLMLKWRGAPRKHNSTLAFGHFDTFDAQEGTDVKDGFCPQRIFQGPTDYLKRLHCHTSTLAPGAGYDPHIDSHDVVIIVLEGEVETLGERMKPHSVIFYAAGEPHGMFNPDQATAKYLVFEFHGTKKPISLKFPDAVRSVLAELADAKLWKRKMKVFIRRSN
jgi:quercetin dioxygenase-like cupin family protein